MRKETLERLQQIKNLAGIGANAEAHQMLINMHADLLESMDDFGMTMTIRMSPAIVREWMLNGLPSNARVGAIVPLPDGAFQLVFTKMEVENAVEEGQEQGNNQPEHSGVEKIGEATETGSGDSDEPGPPLRLN